MRFRRHQEAAENATWGLVLGFVAVLLALLVVVNVALALTLRLTVPFVNGTPALFFETNTAIVLLFVLGGCWVETLRLREGGAHVARLAGARPAAPSGAAQERRLVNVVQEMALASRTRAPDVWVVPRDHSINAFAAGWTRDDAVIAVTQGALDRLTRAELQGLVGHEMGHIVSGDTRLHTRLIGMVWGLQMVHGFGRSLAASDEHGRTPAGAVVGFVLMVVGYVGWLAGRVLQAGVSRQCEYRADASAVQYSRTVDGIGGVLRKIAGLTPQPRPTPPESLAHLWVAEASGFGVFGWRRWLATHPPIAQRLARLYGRAVEALEAPLLPEPGDEPLLRMAPQHLAGDADAAAAIDATSTAAATPSPSTASRTPAAMAPATDSTDPQDECDALQRAAFWRSRGERHGALLAWLIAEDGDAAPWPAWRQHLGPAPFVERLRADWLALGAVARWQVFDTVALQTRGASADDRAALLRAARALAPHGAARLRLMLLRRALREPPPPAGRESLEALATACTSATALLAQAMGPGGAAWAAAVSTAAIGPATTPRQAFGLRRLHAMQRPRVARAWAAAAAKTGRPETARGRSLLVAACRLLDTPPPSTLMR